MEIGPQRSSAPGRPKNWGGGPVSVFVHPSPDTMKHARVQGAVEKRETKVSPGRRHEYGYVYVQVLGWGWEAQGKDVTT